jgi:hypothetical protein
VSIIDHGEAAMAQAVVSEPRFFRDINGDLHVMTEAGTLVQLTTRKPVTFDRPPVERYVRVTIDFGGYTYEPAVEWRDGDGFYEMTERLDAIARDPDRPTRGSDSMEQAELIGLALRGTWPDRAYFVEVWHGEKNGFAQIYQPFGVPRNAP